MRSKTFSNPFAEVFNKSFKVEFIHSGRDRVRFFETLAGATVFASNFSQYQITKPERGQDGNAADC